MENAGAGDIEAVMSADGQSDQSRGDGSISAARQALQSEHSTESVTTVPASAADRDQTYPDGRPIPEYTSAAATYTTHGPFVNCWPPAGLACKFPLGSSKERLVNALTAQSGELVQISLEFEECSDVARFKNRVGRLTQQYGDAYWGALFEGEKREEVFHVGEGVYMLAYVHPEGKEFIDIQKPVGQEIWLNMHCNCVRMVCARGAIG